MAFKITDACVKCGSCADQCPVEAISEGEDKYVIDLCQLRLLRRPVPQRSYRGRLIPLQSPSACALDRHCAGRFCFGNQEKCLWNICLTA